MGKTYRKIWVIVVTQIEEAIPVFEIAMHDGRPILDRVLFMDSAILQD